MAKCERAGVEARRGVCNTEPRGARAARGQDCGRAGSFRRVRPRVKGCSHLVKDAAIARELVLGAHVADRLVLCAKQRVLLALNRLEPIEHRAALLGERVDGGEEDIDGLDVPVRANQVLEVLQQALLVRRLRLGLHHGNLLDLALQNQEAVVVEVDAALLAERDNLGEVGGLPVHKVL